MAGNLATLFQTIHYPRQLFHTFPLSLPTFNALSPFLFSTDQPASCFVEKTKAIRNSPSLSFPAPPFQFCLSVFPSVKRTEVPMPLRPAPSSVYLLPPFLIYSRMSPSNSPPSLLRYYSSSPLPCSQKEHSHQCDTISPIELFPLIFTFPPASFFCSPWQ